MVPLKWPNLFCCTAFGWGSECWLLGFRVRASRSPKRLDAQYHHQPVAGIPISVVSYGFPLLAPNSIALLGCRADDLFEKVDPFKKLPKGDGGWPGMAEGSSANKVCHGWPLWLTRSHECGCSVLLFSIFSANDTEECQWSGMITINIATVGTMGKSMLTGHVTWESGWKLERTELYRDHD